MSSRAEEEREYLNVSNRRVWISATRSPGLGTSDHVSRDRSPNSRLYDFVESSRKIRSAARKSPGSTGRLTSCRVEISRSKSNGLIRRYAASKRVSSASAPLKILTWLLSVKG